MTKISFIAWIPIAAGAAIAISSDAMLQSVGAAVWLLGIAMQVLVGCILLARKIGWSARSISPKGRAFEDGYKPHLLQPILGSVWFIGVKGCRWLASFFNFTLLIKGIANSSPEPTATISDRAELRRQASLKFTEAIETIREGCWELLKDPSRYWLFETVEDIKGIASREVVLDDMISNLDDDARRKLVATDSIQARDVAVLARTAVARLPFNQLLARNIEENGYSTNRGTLMFDLQKTLLRTIALRRLWPGEMRNSVRKNLRNHVSRQVVKESVSLESEFQLIRLIENPSTAVKSGWVASLALWITGQTPRLELQGIVSVSAEHWRKYYDSVTRQISVGTREVFLLARGDDYVAKADSIADELIANGHLRLVSRNIGTDDYDGGKVKAASIKLVSPSVDHNNQPIPNAT